MTNAKIIKFRVENYRNILPLPIEFSDNINVIIGNNGNGKTNLLEAIYFLFKGKSFRKKNNFPQILNSECVKSEIIYNVLLQEECEELFISSTQTQDHSRFFLNNTETKRVRKEVLFISPYEAFQFFNDSSFRRAKVNNIFSGLSRTYKENYKKYDKLLKAKNSVLKSKIALDLNLINIYNQQLAQVIFELNKQKIELISKVSEKACAVFKEIFSKDVDICLKLDSIFKCLSVDEIYLKLKESLEKDLILKTSTIGSHKDDYIFLLDHFPAQEYASLGQQKMGYLSLVFSFAGLIFDKTLSSPIVLIDDVSGELDHIRLNKLVNYLNMIKSQVFITSANEGLIECLDFNYKLIKITNGKFS